MEDRIAQLEAANAELRAENARLRAIIAKLEAALGLNSSNSNKPPSSDSPKARAERNRRKRQRKAQKRGPKPGHKGNHRALLPIEEVDHLVHHKPSHCQGCQAPLTGDDLAPERHQVTDLPPLKAVTTEHQLHRLKCSCCGTSTKAALPKDVGRSRFGTRLKALVCALTGVYRLSKDQAVAFVDDVFGVSISPGSVINIEKQAAALLKPAYDQAEAVVRASSVIYMDETSWRVDRRRGWVWLMTNGPVKVFCITDERSAEVAQDMLEGFNGVLVTDRYGAYTWHPLEKRQFCWAHLYRAFKAMSERDGDRGRIGLKLVEQARRAFEIQRKIRSGELGAQAGAQKLEICRKEVRGWLGAGSKLSCDDGGMCRSLIKTFDGMWTFAREKGVEMTNNAAERALRPAVIHRKTSFGNDGFRGALFTERVLTVGQTLKSQARSLFNFLTRAFDAQLSALRPPRLFPIPA